MARADATRDGDASDAKRRALRDACTSNAMRAMDENAHESALRWISLALARHEMDDGGAMRAAGGTSDGWRRDAIDFVVKGDALMGRGDVRGGAAAYRSARALARRVKRARETTNACGKFECVDADEVSMKLARALVRIGGAESLKAAMACLEETPAAKRTLENRLLAAKIARSEGHDRAAVMAYKEVLVKWPFAIEAVVALAELGVKAVDTRHAIRKAAADAEAEGEDFAVLEAYTTAYGALEAEDYVTAQNAVAQMTRAFPYDPYVAGVKARTDAADGRDVDAAIREYAAIRAMDPHFVEGMDEYGLILYDFGEKRALEALSSEMLRLTPHAAESWTCVALYFDTKLSGREHHSGRDDALVAAEKAVQINPRSHVAHLVLGSLYLKGNRYKAAVRAFNQCNAIKVSMKAYHGLVKSYLALGSMANAMMCARQAHKRSPQNAVAWSLLGDVHAKNKDQYDKAIKAYEQALAYNPRLVRAVKALAALNIRIGKVHVARAILQRQLDDYQPSDEDELIQLYCRLAQALMLSRQTAESVKYYTRALAIRPDCVIAQKALEKFEQTRNPEFAATMSDDEDEGDEAMDEDLRDDMSRGSGGDWMEREAA